jgi:hypothetical protein
MSPSLYAGPALRERARSWPRLGLAVEVGVRAVGSACPVVEGRNDSGHRSRRSLPVLEGPQCGLDGRSEAQAYEIVVDGSIGLALAHQSCIELAPVEGEDDRRW